jgi:3-hydroxyisobutyryl-CoA hydrolase
MEFRVVQRCCNPNFHPDFSEGVRAVLVEKDNNPKWMPRTIQEVDSNKISQYFTELQPEYELNFNHTL